MTSRKLNRAISSRRNVSQDSTAHGVFDTVEDGYMY